MSVTNGCAFDIWYLHVHYILYGLFLWTGFFEWVRTISAGYMCNLMNCPIRYFQPEPYNGYLFEVKNFFLFTALLEWRVMYSLWILLTIIVKVFALGKYLCFGRMRPGSGTTVMWHLSTTRFKQPYRPLHGAETWATTLTEERQPTTIAYTASCGWDVPPCKEYWQPLAASLLLLSK
jgi:hypothetical protein